MAEQTTRASGDEAERLTDRELLAALQQQEEAVALLRAKWAEAELIVGAAPPDVDVREPLHLARHCAWFRGESISEGWFESYAHWIGWWVDTAHLALRARTSGHAVGRDRLMLLCPESGTTYSGSADRGAIRSAAQARMIACQMWGESWVQDSLPALPAEPELERLLTGLTEEAGRRIRVAHRTLVDARRAGEQALRAEESGGSTRRELDAHWHRYRSRHVMACIYAGTIARVLLPR